jgi:hypothetical protein
VEDTCGVCGGDNSTCTDSSPDWSFNATDYQLNSGVTAVVSLNAVAQGGEGDLGRFCF